MHQQKSVSVPAAIAISFGETAWQSANSILAKSRFLPHAGPRPRPPAPAPGSELLELRWGVRNEPECFRTLDRAKTAGGTTEALPLTVATPVPRASGLCPPAAFFFLHRLARISH